MNKWLAQIEGMVTSATAGMTEEQLIWRPEGKWSAAQILEHLAKTYSGTSVGYEKAIAAKQALTTASTQLKQEVAKFVLLRVGYFPPGRKSPERVLPKDEWSGVAALSQTRQELAKMIQAQMKAEEMFAGVKVMDHPVLGPLTPEQWAKFHYVHAKHHMKQVGTLRRQMATASAAHA